MDEDTFFHSRETGGTIVSTALEEMLRVVRERYSPDNWNIYAAQASDGDNYTEDSDRCSQLLGGEILPITPVFRLYRGRRRGDAAPRLPLAADRSVAHLRQRRASSTQNFAMRKVADPTQIFPVFHELFAKHREHG